MHKVSIFRVVVYALNKRIVTSISRCNESIGVLCCSNSDIMYGTNRYDLETTRSLILKLSYIIIMYKVLMVLIVKPVFPRAEVMSFCC